jgi:hypothetical protein
MQKKDKIDIGIKRKKEERTCVNVFTITGGLASMLRLQLGFDVYSLYL